jgi:hypothetical protein
MAALRVEQESSNQLVLGTGLAHRFPNLVSLAVFLLVALSVLSSLAGGNLAEDPVSILVLLFFGFFGLRSVYSAVVTTRIRIDGTARSATRTTSLLGVPIGRNELPFERVRRIIVGSRLPVMTNRGGARGTWQVTLEASNAPSIVVNSSGTHDEMLTLGNKVAALVNKPLTDELEEARSQMQAPPEFRPIEGFGGGGGTTFAPPVAAPFPFGGSGTASQLPEKTPPPNTLATDSESPEHARFEQEAAETTPPESTTPVAPTPSAMPPGGQSGAGTAPISSAPPALELPDQPPLGSIAPASTPIPSLPGAVQESTTASPPRRRSFEELQKAIADDPTDSVAYFQLARLLQSRGAYDQSLDMFQNAVRLDPMNGSIQNDLGVAYFQRGNLKDAETAFRRAVGLDPFSVPNHYNLGVLMARTGRRKDAEQEFNRAQQNARNDQEAQLVADALRGRMNPPMLSPQG